MNTPIEELIKRLEHLRANLTSGDVKLGLNIAVTESKNYLEKEKYEICTAHIEGRMDFSTRGADGKTSEQYYKDKFK